MYGFDASDSTVASARSMLLNQLFAHFLQQQALSATNPQGGPRQQPMPPGRWPGTFNPFGLPRPTGLTASATHGAGWQLGGSDAGHLSLVGQSGVGQGAGPVPMPPVGPPSGIGGPHFLPPAQRPPAGLGPLPGR